MDTWDLSDWTDKAFEPIITVFREFFGGFLDIILSWFGKDATGVLILSMSLGLGIAAYLLISKFT